MNAKPDSADGQASTTGRDVIEAEMLERGELLLSVLERRAVAARAEAETEELKLLLAAARQGDAERLMAWLSHREEQLGEQQGEQRSSSATVPNAEQARTSDRWPGRAASVERARDPSIGVEFSSWDTFLPAARARNARRAALLRKGESDLSAELWLPRGEPGFVRLDPPAASPSKPHGGSTTRQSKLRRDAAGPSKSQGDEAAQLAGVVQKRAVDIAQRKILAKKNAAAEQIAVLAQTFDAEQLEHQEQMHQRQVANSRLRGVAASAIAHLLLLVLLAFVTLKMPAPPASMALESSAVETTVESLELSEPLEVSSPEDSVEPSVQPASFDVSENFSNVTTTVSAVGELAAAGSASVPVSAMLAGASGTPSPMNPNASFFGAAASGNCFCYVIDSSPSMRGGAWEAAKLELLKSLAGLKPKQRFYIIFFDKVLNALPLPGERDPAPHALYATQENLEHARRWIDTIRVGSMGWPPTDAFELAIAKEPDAIYLLTDGVTKVDVADFLRRVNRIDDLLAGEQVRVPIHAIAFYSLDGQQLLKQIAAENKGQFIYVPDPRQR